MRANARAARRRDLDGPIAASRQRAQRTVWAKTGLTTAALLEEPAETLDAVTDIAVDALATEIENLATGASLEEDADMMQFQ